MGLEEAVRKATRLENQLADLGPLIRKDWGNAGHLDDEVSGLQHIIKECQEVLEVIKARQLELDPEWEFPED